MLSQWTSKEFLGLKKLLNLIIVVAQSNNG